jgi:SAM-dependent methyltransferase
MKLSGELQPDQQPARWDDHVDVYEAVFEPLTNAIAGRALAALGLRSGTRLLDVGAGSGGAALLAASHGAEVLAVDASVGMTARICARAAGASARVMTVVMDGMQLALPAASVDAVLSIFGVILFPDAALGMREICRVLRPGGRAAIATWTQIDRYELAARLMAAIVAVRGPPPPASLPAQLRFRDEPVFRSLLTQSGLAVEDIVRAEENWRLPSARWIADHIEFAPGMAAMVAALAADRAAVLDAFVAGLERDQGHGPVTLSAVAHVAIAAKPGGRS